MDSIILAIKPEHAKNIYEFKKHFEFRRVIPKALLNQKNSLMPPFVRAILYESFPVSKITGECLLCIADFSFHGTFRKSIIENGCVSQEQLKKYAGVTEAEKLFRDPKGVFALRITSRSKYEKPMTLQEFSPIEKIKAPQNFIYANNIPF